MTQAEGLECLMLASFTAGWYWSIASMLRSRKPYGKSAPFVACTVFGYVFGLSAKLLAWQQGGVLSDVAFVYIWNLSLTAVDLVLVVHYSRLSRDRISANTGRGRTTEEPHALLCREQHLQKRCVRHPRVSTDEVHCAASFSDDGDAQPAMIAPSAQIIVGLKSHESIHHGRVVNIKSPLQN